MRKARNVSIIFVALVLAALVSSCQTLPERTAEEKAIDEQITSRVEQKLANDVSLNRAAISVSTLKREVTLMGTVPFEGQKEWAGDAAASVDGVESVVNLLDVQTY